MSEIRKQKSLAYDAPEPVFLPRQLTEVYDVIDDAFDNGEFSPSTLEKARKVAKQALSVYEEARESWMVYAELTPDVRIERAGMPIVRTYDTREPLNVYGEVRDVDIVQDIDESDMLALTLESTAVGQYERYIIPLARRHDESIRATRPVDMPALRRDPYVRRLDMKHVNGTMVAKEFMNFCSAR